VTDSVDGDLSPTLILDRLIVSEVEKEFPGLYVPQKDSFCYNFCNKYTMYRQSTVKERLEKLSERGFRM
jgi:hypothetical protein